MRYPQTYMRICTRNIDHCTSNQAQMHRYKININDGGTSALKQAYSKRHSGMLKPIVAEGLDAYRIDVLLFSKMNSLGVLPYSTMRELSPEIVYLFTITSMFNVTIMG